MLTYTDKNGAPLTPKEWLGKFKSPSYSCILRWTKGDITVEASWVGITSTAEGRGCDFLVQAYSWRNRKKAGSARESRAGDIWCATEEEARDCFHQRKKELDHD